MAAAVSKHRPGQTTPTTTNHNHQSWVVLFQTFAAKLLLEVCGAAGCIWGFSEIVGLRNDDTLRFWRPCAIAACCVFFCRWLLQFRAAVSENGLQCCAQCVSERACFESEHQLDQSLVDSCDEQI